MTCPDGVAPEQVCRQTPPLRLVADALERNHPALKARSLRAEVGGSAARGARRATALGAVGERDRAEPTARRSDGCAHGCACSCCAAALAARLRSAEPTRARGG